MKESWRPCFGRQIEQLPRGLRPAAGAPRRELDERACRAHRQAVAGAAPRARAVARRAPEPAAAAARRRELPAVSFAQQRLWLVDQMESVEPLLQRPGGVRLAGALHVERLAPRARRGGAAAAGAAHRLRRRRRPAAPAGRAGAAAGAADDRSGSPARPPPRGGGPPAGDRRGARGVRPRPRPAAAQPPPASGAVRACDELRDAPHHLRLVVGRSVAARAGGGLPGGAPGSPVTPARARPRPPRDCAREQRRSLQGARGWRASCGIGNAASPALRCCCACRPIGRGRRGRAFAARSSTARWGKS